MDSLPVDSPSILLSQPGATTRSQYADLEQQQQQQQQHVSASTSTADVEQLHVDPSLPAAPAPEEDNKALQTVPEPPAKKKRNRKVSALALLCLCGSPELTSWMSTARHLLTVRLGRFAPDGSELTGGTCLQRTDVARGTRCVCCARLLVLISRLTPPQEAQGTSYLASSVALC